MPTSQTDSALVGDLFLLLEVELVTRRQERLVFDRGRLNVEQRGSGFGRGLDCSPSSRPFRSPCSSRSLRLQDP
jgi:hypothetical protein